MTSGTRGRSLLPGRDVGLLVLLACALGVAYVVVVPAGLPYDEPAHWADVQFLVQQHRLFDLRDTEVSYEAQQGPLAYLWYALWVGPAQALGLSSGAAFTLARLAGLVWLGGLVLAVHALCLRVRPGAPRAALVATGVVCLNPVVVAMSASIQNDTPALLLAVALVAVAARPGEVGTARAVATGVLVGAGLLTKLTVAPAVVVLLGVLAGRRVRPSRIAVVVVSALAVSGWWFVRNLVLYGDLTGRAGVAARGFDFPPAPVRGLVGAKDLVAEVVTYLWVPTEYFRNAIDLAPVVRVLLLLVTVGLLGLGLVGLVRARSELDAPAARTAGGTALLALGLWLGTRVLVEGVSVRTAYVALPAWGVVAGAALSGSRRRTALLVAVVAGVAALHVGVLVVTAHVQLGRPLLVP